MNTRKFPRLLLTMFALLFTMGMANAQQISNYLFGQNAWMPDSIGSKKFYGKLEQHWPEIGQSGAKIMRYGGIGVDENRPTKYQYVKMVDAMRAQGIEPILEVSFHKWQYTAAQAADIVNYVNNIAHKNVKYWIIANEPDLGYSYTTASQVAGYIKPFASAMKAADPTIKIIGPECAWYNSGIINGLTTPGGPDDITGTDANGRYYVDYISFHAYPMTSGSTDRNAIIGNLTASGKYQDNLTTLNARLANCNSAHGRTSGNALKTAVTEININYKNPAGDNLYGTGASSFLGAQYWAEIIAISAKKNVGILTFWSVLEGSSEDLSIGYLNRVTYTKKPSYYHFQMMSQNFKGNYADGTDNQAHVKAFGSKDGSQVAVMIMNQDAAANFNYTVRLDNNTVSGTNPLKININAAIAREYSGTIDNQSSLMLIFDLAGNLTKKIEYKLNGNANAGTPPTVTNIAAATPPALTATITPAGPTTFTTGGSVVLNANTGSGYTYQWKKNGTAITGATTASYTATQAGSYTVAIKSGTTTVTSAAVAVTVNALTATITPASSTTIATGGSVVLKANTGTGYTYQWKKNGTAISGATGSSYTATQAGSYTVTIKNGTATATSAAVTVTVSTLTATITPASSTTIATGGSVVLKANTGTGYTYQWKKNGTAISGATAANYTATQAGSYTVTIKSGTATVTSAAVTVTVTTLTAKITPASSTTFPIGGSVVLKANTGTGYIYQWKKNGTAISGATTANYTAKTAGSYQVKITLGTQVAYSAPVTVTVTALAATITPSGSTSLALGGSVVLKANTGSGYTYQWKKNGTAISGATAANYTATKAGSYTVTIKSGTATATSAAVNVTVGSTLTASITVGGSTTIPSGGSVMLYSNTGSGYIYQWKKNGVAITGATSSSYKVMSAGSYQVKITLGTQNAWSAPVSITVGSTVARMQGDTTIADTSATAGNFDKPGDPNENQVGSKRAGADEKPEVGKTRPGADKANEQSVVGKTRAGADKAPEVGKARPGAGQAEESTADSTETASAARVADNVFEVQVGPNPSTDDFGFTVQSSGEETITVRVFDMNGRLCIEEKNVAPNETIKLGYQLSAGHYIAQVEQGQKKQVIKLIKSN